jgi:hypothetical protein
VSQEPFWHGHLISELAKHHPSILKPGFQEFSNKADKTWDSYKIIEEWEKVINRVTRVP